MNKWYAAGLRFSCTQCGKCCTGKPGTVKITEADLHRLAGRGGFSEARFRADYTRQLPDGIIALREREDGACVFCDPSQGCTVYDLRPLQCRTYPFWHTHLESSRAWETAAQGCPGIGQGDLHSADEIEATGRNDGTVSAARRS